MSREVDARRRMLELEKALHDLLRELREVRDTVRTYDRVRGRR